MVEEDRSYPHEKINFNLRPAKRIERKLVAEALTCIYRYSSPHYFGYVGMGSYYFSDFVLFHRMFGINRMISVEQERTNDDRFVFNKPFDCIEMAWGSTNDNLPTLAIFEERPVICWLDYYSTLNDNVISDVQTVIRRAKAGSALLLTLNSKSIMTSKKRLFKFESELSEDIRRLSNKTFLAEGDVGLAKFIAEVLNAVMAALILDLNVARDESDRIEVKQIVNILYRDGEPMITLGWLLLNKSQKEKVEAEPSVLNGAGVVLEGGTMLEVRAPVLTFREIAHLKSILPNGVAKPDFHKKIKAIPLDDAQLFAKLYRYFPSFADVEE